MVSVKLPGSGQPDHVAHRLARAQVRAELADAAVEAELRLAGLRVRLSCWASGLLADGDGQPGHQVGGLAGPLGQGVEAELGVRRKTCRSGQNLIRVPVAFLALLRRPAELAQARLAGELGVRAGPGELAGDAAAEAGRPGPPVPVHLDVQPRGQRVDHRGAHAVQAAGGRVRAAAELAAGVQPGHDQLDAGQLGLPLERRPGCPGRRPGPRPSHPRAGSPRSASSTRPAPRPPSCRRSPTGSAAGPGRRWTRRTSPGACVPRPGLPAPTGAGRCSRQ